MELTKQRTLPDCVRTDWLSLAYAGAMTPGSPAIVKTEMANAADDLYATTVHA